MACERGAGHLIGPTAVEVIIIGDDARSYFVYREQRVDIRIPSALRWPGGTTSGRRLSAGRPGEIVMPKWAARGDFAPRYRRLPLL